MKIKQVMELVLAVSGMWVANTVAVVIDHLQAKVHQWKNKATSWPKIILFLNATASPKVTSYFINWVIK